MSQIPTAGERIVRTIGQGGIGAAVATILDWLVGLTGWDLDPGPGKTLPTPVLGAFFLVGTSVAAWLMNRKPKRIDPPPVKAVTVP